MSDENENEYENEEADADEAKAPRPASQGPHLGPEPTAQPAVEYLWGFLGALRQEGLAPAPSRQADFFRILADSAPRDITRLYWYARLTLLDGVTRLAAFDEVFDAWFRRGRAPGAVPPAPEDESRTRSPQDGGEHQLLPRQVLQGDGVEAAADTVTGRRTFAPSDERQRELMRTLLLTWPSCLPTVRSRRWRPSRTGRRLDMRAVWRDARRTGGEVVELRRCVRPPRTRRLLLLVDVSGSLKEHSPDLLRVAYTALHATAGRTEVFTFGTRLTRVTAALSGPHADVALRALSREVPDADGGTAIGAALEEFLGHSRFLALARGALVVVMSDGLERGDPSAMIRAAGRLSRIGHRLVWWSPLACSAAYRPLTRGMAGQLRHLDHLGGVRDLPSALAEVRRIPAVVAGPRRAARHRWSPSPRSQS